VCFDFFRLFDCFFYQRYVLLFVTQLLAVKRPYSRTDLNGFERNRKSDETKRWPGGQMHLNVKSPALVNPLFAHSRVFSAKLCEL
jgi:hypothetical protein